MTEQVQSPQRKSFFRADTGDRILLVAMVAGFFLVVGLLLLGLNMRRGLNHDEHQFVAGATLVARNSLLPYRDFPYFHVPLLSLIYALLFQSWDRLLLTARVFSVLMAWFTLWLVFAAGFRRRAAPSLRERGTFAALGTLWLASLPIFTYTSGRAWNHDLGVLFLLLAFFIHSDAMLERRSPWWLGASGLLVGLAATTRLSFAVLGLPFLLVIWLYPVYGAGQRWRAALAFVLGAVVGGLPTLALFAADPAAFLFGNVEYVRLNTAYYQSIGATEAMTLWGKLVYFGKLLVLQPADGLAVLVLIIALVPLVGPLRGRLPFARNGAPPTPKEESLFRLAFALLLLAFSLFGAFAATPSQPQYFYALFPLIILGIIYALTAWPVHLRINGLRLFIAGALVSILLAIPAYAPGVMTLFQPAEWRPNKLHAQGQWAMNLVGDGPVLTLSPIPVLEGHAAIYPEFATGPFAWRVAPLVAPAQRADLHLVAPEDLDAFLENRPPAAVLVGLDNDDAAEEEPLVAYAHRRGYVPVALPDDGTLWLQPQARWGGAIVLGGHDLPRDPVHPGDSFVLTLYLQNKVVHTHNLSILVRLVDDQGHELLRDEGWPYGSPTTSWQPGVVWPDGHEFTVPADAAPGYYRVEVSFYDPADKAHLGDVATIGYLAVTPDAAADAGDDAPALAQYGGAIALRTATVMETAVRAGDTVQVDTTWQALAPIASDLTAFLHVLDREGRLVAQHDGAPDGFVPTSVWMPVLPLEETVAVDLPADLDPGTYRLFLGLYDPETLVRVPVTAGDGAGDTVVPLGAIEVGE
ncbi:MAG: hypothetical protein H6644_07615 [Caldilineaceae bacterium]|nr:hypothetical protein [Caldilineaceae bacterium]